MKANRYTNVFATDAKIDSKGKLSLYSGELQCFLQEWKDKKVILTIEVVENYEDWKRKYYFGYIVPEFKRSLFNLGVRMNKTEVDKFLRERSSLLAIEEVVNDKLIIKRAKSISELNKWEMDCFIDELKEFGAELGIYIEDADRFNILKNNE